MHQLHAQIADVDTPLLSVSQTVLGGDTVVFLVKRRHIDIASKNGVPGTRVPMRLDGNVYMFRMWVSRDQPKLFQAPTKAPPSGPHPSLTRKPVVTTT